MDDEQLVAAAKAGRRLEPELLRRLEQLFDAGALWNEPEPFENVANPAPIDFPTAELPDWVRAQVCNVAEVLEVPADLPASMALGVLSMVATMARAAVTVSGNYVETPNLYLVCGMPPGSGKSPAVKNMVKPLYTIAEKVAADDQAANRDASQRRRIADERTKKAERAAAKDQDMEADARQLAIDAEQIVVPPVRQLIANDVTPEAFAQALADNGGTLSLVSDEGGVIEGLGRYLDKGKPPNLDGILQAWSGGSINIRRKGTEAVVIDDPRAVIAITAQPHTLRRMLADTEFEARGLLDRFLISVPQSKVGYRTKLLLPVDQATSKEWSARVIELHHTLTAGPGRLYGLDADAKSLLIGWEQATEPNRKPGGTHHQIVGLSSKMQATAARLALIFHLCDQPELDNVDAVSMAHALRVVEHYLGHAKALKPADVDPDVAGGFTLVRWMLEQHHMSCTPREVSRSSVLRATHGATYAALIGPLTRMERSGWLRVTPAQTWADSLRAGKATNITILIHPAAGTHLDRLEQTAEREQIIDHFDATANTERVIDLHLQPEPEPQPQPGSYLLGEPQETSP